MIVDVEVTQEDIANGERKCSGSCAISLALSRLIADGLSASVTGLDIALVDRGRGFVWSVVTPMSAEDFIWHYDAGDEVHPFKFPLDIPEQFLRKTT